MRAGPLSNKEIVQLLNSRYIPVYAVNEDYREDGPQPPEEKAAYRKIFKQSAEKKLSTGTVHVYILSPEGEVVDALHVVEGAKQAVLKEALEKNADHFSVSPGKPVLTPKPQVSAPECHELGLRLHLVARSLDGKGVWTELPGEDWIILIPPEARHFIPEPGVDSWSVRESIAKKILQHFYAGTESNDVTKNKFRQVRIDASVIQHSGNTVSIRLDGEFEMEHWFYHKPDGKVVKAQVTGYYDYNDATEKLSNFQMVTERATYNGGSFGVAVRSVP